MKPRGLKICNHQDLCLLSVLRWCCQSAQNMSDLINGQCFSKGLSYKNNTFHHRCLIHVSDTNWVHGWLTPHKADGGSRGLREKPKVSWEKADRWSSTGTQTQTPNSGEVKEEVICSSASVWQFEACVFLSAGSFASALRLMVMHFRFITTQRKPWFYIWNWIHFQFQFHLDPCLDLQSVPESSPKPQGRSQAKKGAWFQLLFGALMGKNVQADKGKLSHSKGLFNKATLTASKGATKQKITKYLRHERYHAHRWSEKSSKYLTQWNIITLFSFIDPYDQGEPQL